MTWYLLLGCPVRDSDTTSVSCVMSSLSYLDLQKYGAISGTLVLHKDAQASDGTFAGSGPTNIFIPRRPLRSRLQLSEGRGATEHVTVALGVELRHLFGKLGLELHSENCKFSGKRQLEILGILVDT